MSVPSTTVAIAFDLSGVSPDFFTLDDPVKGELDNVTYLLAGDILQDVTSFVRAVQVSRGRSRELDRYSTGSARVLMDNRARTFDPTDVATPYLGQIMPRKAIEIVTGSDVVFTGNVQDWGYAYELSGDATVDVSAVDGFGVLARQNLATLAVGTALASDRVDDILDAVSWPSGKRDIGVSSVALAAGTADGNALQYLQSIETVEAGDFFMTRDGLATFRARGTAYTDTDYDAASSYDSVSTPYSYPIPAVTTDIIFTDERGDSLYVPYVSLLLELGTDLLYNEVAVTYGTATITSQDADSQVTYGAAVMSVNGDLLASSAAGTALADYLVARYRQPVIRFSEIAVELAGLDDAVRSKVLQLDLGDVIPVRFRPGSTGSRTERRSIVEGIAHDIRPASHRITFRFSGSPGS